MSSTNPGADQDVKPQVTSQNTKRDESTTAWLRSWLLQTCLLMICYRYEFHLKNRALPNVTEDAIRRKAAAGIASSGVLFGFVAAAIASAAVSENARKDFRGPLDVLRAVGLYGWIGVFVALTLPYLVVWQERFISKGSVRFNDQRETEFLRSRRTWVL